MVDRLIATVRLVAPVGADWLLVPSICDLCVAIFVPIVGAQLSMDA